MRSKFFTFNILLFSIMLLTACSSQNTNLTLADRGTQVEIKEGLEITITLDGNPSTGYTWEVKDLDTDMFQQVGEPVFESSNPGMVGSGGTLTLTFKTLKVGTNSLTLIYHRPWETEVDPIDTYTVTIVVK